ncbi:DUF1810 domain-containing protein [Nisaea acidiphila]|uniref:DUF1810 domain-containing protein n=1 Tax=Nisaea acidiphila TaxID=1862145 RepID=A0A9J7ATF0_9PROT|nr:DUF1810 domain-containing protein [Nisaea acidiphila]UUX50608.1 DUF1810 domain-containing protein [Nisaea acidiphila]
MTDEDLRKFVEAQERDYERALGELRAGRKTSHWIWFVLPQLAELGRSQRAVHYGITGLDQARRYLADPVLGPRLRACVEAMLSHSGLSAFEILGSPDDMKLCSCLTLFEAAAGEGADRMLFARALDRFYDGARDRATRDLIAGEL